MGFSYVEDNMSFAAVLCREKYTYVLRRAEGELLTFHILSITMKGVSRLSTRRMLMKNELSITNSKELFEILAFSKGFSIVCIVFSHLINDFMTGVPHSIRLASAFGGTGVHAFFIASGIGLYYSHLCHQINIFEYCKRRFQKVYIPYI